VVGGVTHPMAPTCHGFGGIGYNCATAYPGDSGKRRGSGFGSTTYAVKVDLPGCFAKPCWLQEIRVGVDESNSVASLAKMGVYRSDGTLAKASETLQMPTSLQDHAWLSFTFLGYDNELKTLSEQDHVWLVFNSAETVKLTYENAASADEATRYVAEDSAEAFEAMRQWELEPGRRQWAGHFRQLRMQLTMGDVSVMQGTLPLILEAPHGGRIWHGWPARVSGVMTSDQNTDLFTEELRSALTLRCGRSPTAVIFRVARQGIDANRATGNGSWTPQGEACSEQSNGECCCHLAQPNDTTMAMNLNDIYHSILAEEVAHGNGALLVPIHATGKHRVEVGVRLSASRLTQGANQTVPALSNHNAYSSLRALGDATELVWGSSSLGSYISAKRPSMEVIPSSQLLCPDPTVCAQSSYSSLFMGGYNLKIHVTENQPGVQLELPQVMRGFGSSPPTVEPAAVRQVAAALASFLNHHYSETCETDVNFGLPCLHGSAVYGTCVCNEGYAGTDCSDCAEGYLAVNGQCMRLVMLSPPSEATQKYASAFPTTSSGKKYLYTRKFSAQLPECVAGCRPLNISLRVRCDSGQCHSDLDASNYTIGAALYDATGLRLCNATIARTPQSVTDWWLDIPLPSCPLLNDQVGALYVAMWTSKWIKLRWEQEPALTARTRGLQYKVDVYQQDPNAQSADLLVDAVPPTQLPSWRDVPCVSSSCESDGNFCDCISGCTCRSWILSGIRNYYGLMATLSMQPS